MSRVWMYNGITLFLWIYMAANTTICVVNFAHILLHITLGINPFMLLLAWILNLWLLLVLGCALTYHQTLLVWWTGLQILRCCFSDVFTRRLTNMVLGNREPDDASRHTNNLLDPRNKLKWHTNTLLFIWIICSHVWVAFNIV